MIVLMLCSFAALSWKNEDVIAHKQPLFWRTYSTMHLKEMQENARCNSEVNEQHYWNIKTDIQY